ncbi:UNVERIFIED_CONTAM: Kinesin light chain 3 [Siphonaria sp. JEL0065]|nr:Kinesin light chain 3 [Siphonaria sp. JEL0065]
MAIESDELSSTSMSTKGIRFSHVYALIEEWGGRDALVGKSTSEINVLHLQPSTLASKLSLCNQYARDQERSHFVCEASYFVSHAWMSPFLNVIDSLEAFFKDANVDLDEAVIWFDLFSNSQHDTGSRPFIWWQTTFMQAVEKIGNVVMILEPFLNPVPLKRVWCGFEIYACKTTNSNFHVAMTPTQRKEFLSSLINDPKQFYSVLSNVRCENAEATNPDDRDKIFQVVLETLGSFTQMDRLIYQALNTWTLSQLKSLSEGNGASALQTAKWKFALAQVHSMLGEPEATRALCEQVVNSHPLTDDEGSDRLAVKALNLLAVSLLDLGRLDEAADKCKQVLKALPTVNVDTAAAKSNLSLICMKQGHYSLSEAISLVCIQELVELYGLNHINVFDALNNLAVCYISDGQFTKSRDTSESIVERAQQVFGPNHPSVWIYAENLGRSYRELQQWGEAEDVYFKCWTGQRRAFGLEHPDTLASQCGLAEVRLALKYYPESLAMFQSVWETRVKVLGETHMSTLQCLNSVARVCLAQNELDLAESTMRRCLQSFKDTYGETNPNTVATMSTLARICEKLEKFDESEQLRVTISEISEKTRGPNHPDFLNNQASLGCLYFNQQRYSDAILLFERILPLMNQVFGETDGNTLLVMKQLASSYLRTSNWEEAQKLYKRLLVVENPPTSDTVFAFAQVEWNLGNSEHTKGLLLQVSRQPNDDEFFDAMGFIVSLSKKMDGAKELLDRFVDSCVEQRGIRDIYTLHIMAKRADFQEECGQLEECLAERMRILELAEELKQEGNAEIGLFVIQACSTLGDMKRYQEAIVLIEGLLKQWDESGTVESESMATVIKECLVELQNKVAEE